MQNNSLKTISVNPMDGDDINKLMESRGGRIVRLDAGNKDILDPLKKQPSNCGRSTLVQREENKTAHNKE